jgi:two-component system chemotaxis sensor kinase CheA
MALDMSQFHQAFFEECAESLDNMESGLLNLGSSADNVETINTIFRGAHSIKGGAATFGFMEISGFTHVMETLLDQVREGTRQINQPDVDLLLASVDCVRSLLNARQNNTDYDTARTAELKSRLETALASTAVAPAPLAAATVPAKSVSSGDEITEDEFDKLLDDLHGKAGAPGAVETAGAGRPTTTSGNEITEDEFDSLLDQLHGKGGAPGATHGGASSAAGADWRISFRPRPGMMQKGNDPIRFFRELETLGKLTVTVDEATVPQLTDMDPLDCALGWTLELTSQASREQIEEVFAWVDGECDLNIKALRAASTTAAPNTAPTAREIPVTPSAPVSIPAPAPVAVSPAASPDSIAPRVTAPAGGAPASGETANAPSSARGPQPNPGAEGTSIRVGIDKIDALINMVGELVITQSMLSQLSDNFEMGRLPKLMSGLTQLERNTRELQESVMRIRMLPISFAFNRFPRLVHDISSKLGKKVELKMTGEQTELDKTVMEKIGDPLVHLVRNSLDHGLETPDVRKARGKPETGTLHLNAYHQSGNIVIEIADDGAGLPKEKILKKARERGLIKDDAVLTDAQIYDLIFLPGFSTADQVSDLSGRGVGMDVVRKNIKALGGQVEIRSLEGKGTTITIRLPLTLAILDGQTVRVGNEIYLIPLISIVESIKIKNDMVNMVAGRGEVIRLREEYLQVLRLYNVFDAQPTFTNLEEGLLVVVEGEGLKAGLFVDELLGQQQIVIKSLEANFKRIEGVSGATILGDGTVSLILDIPGLIKRAHQQLPGALHQPSNASLAA